MHKKLEGKPVVAVVNSAKVPYDEIITYRQTEEQKLVFFCHKNKLEQKVGAELHKINEERFFACDGNFFFNKDSECFEGVIIARDLTANEARGIIEKVTGNRPVAYSYTEDDDSPYDSFGGKCPRSYFISENNWGYATISGRTFAYENSLLIAEGRWWFQSDAFYEKVINAISDVLSDETLAS